MAIGDIPGDFELARRKRQVDASLSGAASLGMTLTPEQMQERRRAHDMQQASSRIRETRQEIGRAAEGIGDGIDQAWRSVKGSLGLSAASDVLTGKKPLNIYDRPFDYSDSTVDRSRAQNWARQNPGQAASAQQGIRDIAGRATASAQQPFSIPQPIPSGAGNLPIIRQQAGPASSAPAASSQENGDSLPRTSPAQVRARQDEAALNSGWSRTGIDDLAGRMNASGVPEFTNNRAITSGAGPRQVIGTVGDGIGGGISFGQPGDAQRAIAEYDQAIAERDKMIQAGRRGGIGEFGGLTVVYDSSTREGRQANQRADEVRRQDITDGLERAMQERKLAFEGDRLHLDFGLREREAKRLEEESQLQRQQTQQSIDIGGLELRQKRQLDELRRQLTDPSLKPEQRDAAERTYSMLTGSYKDRYMEVRGGTDSTGNKEPSRVYDRVGGRYVGTRSVVGNRAAVWDGGRWVEEKS